MVNHVEVAYRMGDAIPLSSACGSTLPHIFPEDPPIPRRLHGAHRSTWQGSGGLRALVGTHLGILRLVTWRTIPLAYETKGA